MYLGPGVLAWNTLTMGTAIAEWGGGVFLAGMVRWRVNRMTPKFKFGVLVGARSVTSPRHAW